MCVYTNNNICVLLDTLTLPTSKLSSVTLPRKKNIVASENGQNPPDWVENFANKNKIVLDKDKKLAE